MGQKRGYRHMMTASFHMDDDLICYEDIDAYDYSDDEYHDSLNNDSEEKLVPTSTLSSSASSPSPSRPSMQQCPICCEEVSSLTPLMKNCNHPPCCQNCLREIYINQAQQDITNYPLQCYHPCCTKVVRDTQLVQHNLVRSDAELKKHYRFTTLAKAYRDTQKKRVIHCPKCETPRVIGSSQEIVIKCKECHTKYAAFNHYHTTIAAVEAFAYDTMGNNNGWARCPKCKMIISKGNGCDHMTCVCGHHFSWNKALKKKDTRYNDVKLVVPKTIDNIDILKSLSATSR